MGANGPEHAVPRGLPPAEKMASGVIDDGMVQRDPPCKPPPCDAPFNQRGKRRKLAHERRVWGIAMDIGEWLRRLDLAQYVEAFAANAIDWSVLPSLTADDLQDIGVAAVGHRRKLLNAIAALSEPAATASVPAPQSTIVRGAERRQLSVMFCDLVGSTALSARLDPEDLREVYGAYHTAVAQEVGRFGGFVAKYMGDGALTYFGYPEAHEDDAERAVRTGLALAERVAQLKTHARLESRIGIATGLVVVGDLIGQGEAQERGIVGETPNLAARM